MSYDKHGNPQKWFKHGTTSQLKYSLMWEQVNRLTEITDKETNNKYEYTYNYQGIRTQKKVGDTEYKYYLDGKKIIQETRTTGSEVEKIQYYYGATGIVGFNYKGENYYFLKNIQGDIIGIYDSEGNIYGEYSYDTWGKCTIVTDKYGIATINPFRYRGYYLDNETGLCYLNSRYYDPVVGRFLSPDSLEYLDPEALGGLNLYSYCNNNPVMYVDPNGNVIISALLTSFLIGLGIAAGIGAGVGALSYVVSVGLIGLFTGNFSWSWGMFLGSILGGAIGGALTFVFQIPIGIGAAITGGLSTAIGMTLSNAFGESNYSCLEILGVSVASAFLSGIASAIMSKIKIPGLTGRGSYGQISKQIFTKFHSGLIRSITAKTFGKMFVYSLAYNALNILTDGIMGIIDFFTSKKKKKKTQEFIIGG